VSSSRLNPSEAAQFALIAICLVLIGAIVTEGTLGIAERGTVLAGVIAVLFFVAYRQRKRGPGGVDDGGEDVGTPYIPGE
jgi:hypothetical protein